MSFNPVARETLGMLACRPTRHTSSDWSKVLQLWHNRPCFYTSIQRKYKVFLGVIPHVNMSWIYLYMIKSFRIHCTTFSWAACGIFLGLQVKLLILVWFAHIYHHLYRQHLVLCYPRMEWPSSRMGWPYSCIGRILLMLVMSSPVDAQTYQAHAVVRYPG